MIHDPTRTKMLRQQYSKQLIKLYRNFGRNIIPVLIDYVQNRQHKKSIRQLHGTPFDDWLDFQITDHITNPSENVIQRNIKLAYQRGKQGARNKLIPIEIAENMTPLDWMALDEIEYINYNRIVDCTNSMKNAIKYSCSRGIMEGWGAQKIAYELRNNVTGNQNMGITRARMIARTEVINAYNTAARKTYEQAGLTEKQMIWITSFDERTCPVCSGYDEKPLSEIGEYPPIHPNCRCSIIPKPEK